MKTITYKRYVFVTLLILGFSMLLLGPTAESTAQESQALSIPATVIFDLGNVLFTVKKSSVLWELGAPTLIAYMAISGHNPITINKTLKKKLFALLEAIQPQNGPISTFDDQGNPLPRIMYEWLTGQVTGKQIEKLVHAYLQNNSYKYGAYEALLLKRLTHCIFDPKTFARNCVIEPDAITMVKACKKRGYNVAILSNWDKESFSILQRANPKLFKLFDQKNIFISGQLGYAKPDPAIYKKVLETIPGLCLFIDDQPENIAAANQAGMKAILYQKKSKLFGFGSTSSNFMNKAFCVLAQAQKNLQYGTATLAKS